MIGMAILLKSVNQRKMIGRNAPLEKKREIVMDELKALNVTVARSGKSLEELNYEELKEEWVFASILQVDIEHPENKWFR